MLRLTPPYLDGSGRLARACGYMCACARACACAYACVCACAYLHVHVHMCTVDAADRVAYLHTIYSPAPSASREPALKTNTVKKANRGVGGGKSLKLGSLAATQTHVRTHVTHTHARRRVRRVSRSLVYHTECIVRLYCVAYRLSYGNI